MKTRAAVVWPGATTFSVEEVELDPPGPGEVLVRLTATGLCHSDHFFVSGDYEQFRRPVVPGHEGTGVVEVLGQGVTRVQVGDRVVLAVPLSPCGSCPACLDGLTHLCERGGRITEGFQISDGTARHHARGEDLSIYVFLGTFAHHTVVNAEACVVVDDALPPEVICTLACAGVTGWGAALNSAEVRAGDVVVVAGFGGIGANAMLGARYAGARAVVVIDPVVGKRELAVELGATAAVADFDGALAVVRELTEWRGANQVIMAMSQGDGRYLQPALELVGKRGRVVIVNVHPNDETSAIVNLKALQGWEKQVVGCLAGGWDGRKGIAFLLRLHQAGLYDPTPLVSKVYGSLEEVTTGFADQAAGTILRGTIRLS